MKRILSGLLALIFIISVCPAALAFSDSAKSSILYEPESGAVLYEKNADDRRLIASTTKIMTALVTIENAALDEVVTVPKVCETVGGTSLHIRGGAKYTVEELLYGLLLESANDVAVALACHVAGNVPAFADLMNARAESLGLENTHFMNPNGLDHKEHYSSARDLAKIAAEALKNDTFKKICSTKTIKMMGITMTNHNRLLGSVEGMYGVKNGYTMAAGRTLVTAVERDGMTLIYVTLSDTYDQRDHRAVYDEFFPQYKLLRVTRGEAVAEAPLIAGYDRSAEVTPAETRAFLLNKDDEVKTEIYLPRFFYAPCVKGAEAGEIAYFVNSEELFRTKLVFAETKYLKRSQRPGIFERIADLADG